MLIFYILSIINAQTCNKQDLLITCYLDSYQSYMATYQKLASDTMFLFIGPKPGQSAFFFDQLGVGPSSNFTKWNDLGHLMFLDLQGAGYTIEQKTPKTIQEYTQLYVSSFNSFKQKLDFQFTRIYVVTSGISSKIALEIALQLQAYTILFSPLLDLWENMKNLPASAYHMGLIDILERQQLEKSLLDKTQSHYKDYQYLVNKVSKLSGDMQISDFRKYEQDNSTIVLTDIMNNKEVKKQYNAENQFFKTFNVNIFNNLIDALSIKTDLTKYISSELKIICFIPQFSIATNILGTLSYFQQYPQFQNKTLKYHYNENEFTIYTQLESLYIIQNSGDKSYQDQSQIIKDILIQQK